MEHNFRRCINFVLVREAGYVNDPDDPGGATNRGITIKTLSDWRGKAASERDVQRLTQAEAERIYHARYWKRASCPELPAGIDLLVLDACVLSGVDPALNFLARRLGLPVKMRNHRGVFPATERHVLRFERQRIVDHAQRACMPALICGVSEQRRAFYRSLSTFKKFGRGWLRRVDLAQELAMHLWVTQGPAAD